MPLKSYGVLQARVVGRVREGVAEDTPHYQVHLVDDLGIEYRAAVNVKSKEPPSELLYFVDNRFSHPITAELDRLPSGWTALPAVPAANIDFIRANLFHPSVLRPLPAEQRGQDNDLCDLLDLYITRASTDPSSRVFAFGERWGPEADTADKVFGFLPGAGVHDIHMNQGNAPLFYDDDGVWQDGALLLRFPRNDQWVAIFLAFQSQTWHTNDATGHSLGVAGDEPPRPGATRGRVKIMAAMANPAGDRDDGESVTLLNVTPEAIDLTGWSITDAQKHAIRLPPQLVTPGAGVRIPLAPPVLLGNSGGLITLLDPRGVKVDGVAYRSIDAKPQGWTITF